MFAINGWMLRDPFPAARGRVVTDALISAILRATQSAALHLEMLEEVLDAYRSGGDSWIWLSLQTFPPGGEDRRWKSATKFISGHWSAALERAVNYSRIIAASACRRRGSGIHLFPEIGASKWTVSNRHCRRNSFWKRFADRGRNSLGSNNTLQAMWEVRRGLGRAKRKAESHTSEFQLGNWRSEC